MEFILETIAAIIHICYYILEGMVKAVLPAKYLSNKDISKDTVLVTGAGSGIGRALSISLAKLGCTLILWDNNEEGNQETAAEIKRFGGQAHSYTVDLSQREEVYKMADKVLTEIGPVQILVNNAGVVTARNFLKCPDEKIKKTLDVNTLAHFWTTKAFLPSMMDKDYGHIVSVSSATALFGTNGLTDYSASKSAASGFLESLSLELKRSKKAISTTVVCPLLVNTDMVEKVNVTWSFPQLLPILETDYVAAKIVEAIRTNQTSLYLPKIMYLAYALKGWLPDKATQRLLMYLGLTTAMSDELLDSQADK